MNDVLQFLGLLQRSGQVISGEDTCLRAIRERNVDLIILAQDTGANGAKKIKNKCAFYEVPCITAFHASDLGRAIGKSSRNVVGITSKNLAIKIRASLNDQFGGDSI
nr:hypothetical protein [Bacilli bacterium]